MDQRNHLSLSKTNLHSNSMDEDMFCDNIVFNNMPIYTYLFLYFMLPVMEYFAVSSHFVSIMFDCIIAPPGGLLQ